MDEIVFHGHWLHQCCPGSSLFAVKHFVPFTHLAISCFSRLFSLQKTPLLFCNIFLLNPLGKSTGYIVAVNVRALSRACLSPRLSWIAFGNLCQSSVFLPQFIRIPFQGSNLLSRTAVMEEVKWSSRQQNFQLMPPFFTTLRNETHATQRSSWALIHPSQL